MEEINPSVKDILDAFYEWAPAELALSWDNPGQTIGDPGRQVKKICCALDISLSTIDFAKTQGAQLLVTHHPILISPIKSVLEDAVVGKRIIESISGGISIISLHTNLDAAKGGVNDLLSELFDVKGPAPVEDSDGANILRIGQLVPPRRLDQLLAEVKEKLGCQAVFYTGRQDQVVSRLAICGGSGGSYWQLAKDNGADCLLTGEVRHHDALDARDAGFSIVGAGHFETELPIVKRMAEFLNEKAAGNNWDIEVYTFSGEASPIEIFY